MFLLAIGVHGAAVVGFYWVKLWRLLSQNLDLSLFTVGKRSPGKINPFFPFIARDFPILIYAQRYEVVLSHYFNVQTISIFAIDLLRAIKARRKGLNGEGFYESYYVSHR